MKLEMIIISLLVFSMATAGILLVPQLDGDSGAFSFFKAYDYTPPDNNLSQFDYQSDTYSKIQEIKCDINPDDDECPDEKQNVYQQVSDFTAGMFQGGYGALITISKSIGLFDSIITDAAQIIGIPEIIWKGFISIIAAAIFITVVLVIFNRSDIG